MQCFLFPSLLSHETVPAEFVYDGGSLHKAGLCHGKPAQYNITNSPTRPATVFTTTRILGVQDRQHVYRPDIIGFPSRVTKVAEPIRLSLCEINGTSEISLLLCLNFTTSLQYNIFQEKLRLIYPHPQSLLAKAFIWNSSVCSSQ